MENYNKSSGCRRSKECRNFCNFIQWPLFDGGCIACAAAAAGHRDLIPNRIMNWEVIYEFV